MGKRSITDFPRNEVGYVDEFIGTAYDVVKAVYDNLPQILHLAGVFTEVPDLANRLTEIDNRLAAIEQRLDALET